MIGPFCSSTMQLWRICVVTLLAGLTMNGLAGTPNAPLLTTNSNIPAPPPGDHGYFELLASQPEAIKAVSLRNQSEINEYLFGDQQSPPVAYNATQDACEWPFPPGKGSFFHGQVRINYPEVNRGKVLLHWEAKWSSGWAQAANFSGGQGQGEHKAFQIARDGSGDERRFETQVRYTYGPTPRIPLSAPEVAHLTLRTYGGGGVSPSGQPISGQERDFVIYPDRWVRFWQEVDIDRRTFSWWVADPEQGIVQLFRDRNFSTVGNLPFNWFWFEWNASTERVGGQTIYTWARNFVVLRDYDDAQILVDQGGF